MATTVRELNLYVPALDTTDVRPLAVPDGDNIKYLQSTTLQAVRQSRTITLDTPRGGSKEVRVALAEQVFNLPNYAKLISACEAARTAFRSGPTKDKDYSWELKLLNEALG